MLRRLSVKNLAIVEDLEMDLEAGLTVITGETGAGKSILVDALSLLAGGRGSVDLVRDGAPRLTVSGEFDADGPIRRILSEAGLPDSATLLLRRELSPDGKGRVFIEDEPASVRTLAKIGDRLVAIHGQSSERDLADPETPLELLDAFASAEAESVATSAAAEAWAAARRALEDLEASRRDRGARLEMLDYQIREIREAAPDEKEEGELLVERDRLLHADRIRSAAETALLALSEDEGSAADRLGEAAKAFAQLAAIDPAEQARVEEVEELKRRVADLAASARDTAGSVEGDPERLTGIESRLEKLARIKRKYGGTLADVLALAAKLARERDELSDIEDALDRRQKEEQGARLAYRKAAGALAARRGAAAPRFSSAVEKELHALAMDKARFQVEIQPHSEEAPRASGSETASFLFAPNPGEAAKPVEKIASGGELSRLHLAIQSVAAARRGARRTLVFDEVDSGIGGRAAEVVGRKLKALAARSQVLCVTHVPQIAALADRHYLAEKHEAKGRTIAAVRRVEGKDRVAEIARMLAGEKVPETAVRHARTLLEAGEA
ncbi:MAG TPA: DNA repair protein RecN [Thermoanaerobaculia bacterium]|nr:DNA repair protein RecN [Thermoanaerobaculia bacterium]